MEVRTSLPGAVRAEVDASLAPVDADLALRCPGDPGGRQPVHTVYVPADVFGPGTVREWGRRALAALDEHAPGPAVFARVLGLPEADAAEVYGRVRAKLAAEPVEDLRIDFEDGYGPAPTTRRTGPPSGRRRWSRSPRGSRARPRSPASGSRAWRPPYGPGASGRSMSS